MKITLRPKGATSSADVVLADGADRADDNVRGPARAEISVSIAVQQSAGIRAAATRFFSRANRSGSYSFVASRRFAALADAGRFILLHGTECPADGTLIFDFGDTEADPPGKLVLLLGACIRQIGPMQQAGVTIRTNYAVNYSMAVAADEDEVQDVVDAYYAQASYLTALKINCGADDPVDEWLPDTYNYGGATNYYDPLAEISGTGEVPLDVYRRIVAKTYANSESRIEYVIPLNAGTYSVKLHFFTPSETNNYIVNVAFNGTYVQSGLDILAVAGGAYKALVREFSYPHALGNLVLTVHPSGSGKIAMLCGIEITEVESE